MCTLMAATGWVCMRQGLCMQVWWAGLQQTGCPFTQDVLQNKRLNVSIKLEDKDRVYVEISAEHERLHVITCTAASGSTEGGYNSSERRIFHTHGYPCLKSHFHVQLFCCAPRGANCSPHLAADAESQFWVWREGSSFWRTPIRWGLFKWKKELLLLLEIGPNVTQFSCLLKSLDIFPQLIEFQTGTLTTCDPLLIDCRWWPGGAREEICFQIS